MCGIVGFVGARPLLELPRFIAMRDSLAHRGPDDSGLWSSSGGNVLLGSRRLAILDLSPAGHMPMLSSRGNLVIVFNGEIYNFVEIREELLATGYCFRSSGDTEVLLAAYDRWGTSCVDRLNGMFAFAIWDDARKELFAARDRFGEKPFYYYVDSDLSAFLFASEIKAILFSGLIQVEANNQAVYRFLVNYELDQGAETLFKGVKALPPAHALKYSLPHKKLESWRYWDIDPEVHVFLRDDDAYAERMRALVEDSVRLRLRSDVPIGSSLSGGLDSSTVVGLVSRRMIGGRQATFSARFHDEGLDEGFYIGKVAEYTGVENHGVYPDPSTLSREMEELTWHQEHPFYSCSIYAQWCVMRLAKEHGVTVLLDGQGADEILAGYHSYFGSYYKALLSSGRFREFLTSLVAYTRQHSASALPMVILQMFPPRTQTRIKQLIRPRCLRHEFERESAVPPSASRQRFGDELSDELYETLTRSSLPALLRYADRNSMAFSRELRLPFLDHRLVEFLFSIPPDQRLRGTTTKVVLRNAIKGLVPEEVRTRKDKIGYAPPQAKWLRRELREWAEGILHSKRFRQREWIDADSALKALARFLSGKSSLHSLVWRWASLEMWAQVFLDRDWKAV